MRYGPRRFPKGQNLDKIFQANLSRKRTEAGLSFQGLAKKAGLTAPYVYQIETGQRHPTMLTISKIALALGSDVSSMLAPRRIDDQA